MLGLLYGGCRDAYSGISNPMDSNPKIRVFSNILI